ncbi:MAG: ABC transporter ATP-binding protein [Bacilli bacterium]|nr:ABC transporter ATP-binding protein [Bacilli bacterium]
MLKKLSNFKILYKYLKDDKLKIFIYILLVLTTYLPAVIATYLWGKSVELLILKDFYGFIKYLICWEAIYIVCYNLLQIPREKLYNYFEIKFMKNVSKDLYQKIDNLPAIAFEEIGVGEFINRLHSDTDRVMSLLNRLIKLICKALIVIVVLIISYCISWVLGLEITIFGLIMGFISYKFFPKIKTTQESIKKETDKYVKKATENITGIREIKALGIKKNTENSIFSTLNDIFTNEKKIRNYEIFYYSFNGLCYFTLQFFILFTAAKFFVQGKIVYALFTMLDSFIWRIDDVVESISDFGINYNKVTVSLKRIDEIVNNKLYEDEKFGNKELKNITGIIKFKDVKFKYRDEEDYTLRGLNLTLEPNKKIAIVGRSGNGKSTLFNLLLRYFDTKEGSITIDDTNITELTEESLRNSISVIRQAPFLFNMSILDNFKIVKENVTIEEVKEVCKKAYIDKYIESLPEKYDTIIGEGGINLSGGQKQRIAIARTLLLNTKIILFDEATSALDNESQKYIKKTIDNLVKDHTIIIVAHRLSTIVDADEIHVIDKGKLVASGKHEELLISSEVYKKLYSSELEEE